MDSWIVDSRSVSAPQAKKSEILALEMLLVLLTTAKYFVTLNYLLSTIHYPLPDYGLSVVGLAEGLAVSRQTVNELVRERRAVSPGMAIRLARFFGNTPEFWLNAQRALDLWKAARTLKTAVKRIRPLKTARQTH